MKKVRSDGQQREWIRVFLRAERLDWVAQRLAALDCPFVVEYAPELSDAISRLAGRLAHFAHQTADHQLATDIDAPL